MKGITFANQATTDKNLASIQGAMLPDDGILKGCEMSYSGASLTVGVGYLMLCGRVIHIDTAETLAAPTTQAYVRLRAVIDMTQEATRSVFEQVRFEWDSSGSTSFAALTQEDVNASGTTYEQEIAVVSIAGGAISSVVRSIGQVGAVPTTRKVNNKALSADITLTAADVGAVADSAQTGTISSTGSEWSENNTVLKKVGRTVFLYLAVKKNASTNASSTMMTLPEGFRPARTIYFSGPSSTLETGTFRLTNAGVLTYMFKDGSVNAGTYYGTLVFGID